MGMPPQEAIDAWKNEYGKVYHVALADIDFIFRELTLEEFYRVEAESTSVEREDKGIALALLHPLDADFESLSPGVASELFERILDSSNYMDPGLAEEMLEQARERTSNVFGMMKSFIVAAMPTYTEEALDKKTLREILDLVAFSEQVFSIQQSSMGLEGEFKLKLFDKEEEGQKGERPVRTNEPGKADPRVDPIAAKLMGGG